MVFIALAFISTCLYSGLIYTGETEKFCTYGCSSFKVAQSIVTESRNLCWFNKQYREEIKVTPITQFPQKAIPTEKLDDIDKLIFSDKETISYSYKEIMKEIDINVYVLKEDYILFRNHAVNKFQAKSLALRETLADLTSSESDIEQKKSINKALQRIEKYMYYLNTFTQYQHECVGIIVPMRSVLCMRNWIINA